MRLSNTKSEATALRTPIFPERIGFRSLTEADFPRLHGWLAAEHVRRWWEEDYTLAQVAEKYGPRVRGEVPTRAFLLQYDGRPAGYLQTYRLADYPEYAVHVDREPGAAGVDLFVGEEELLYRGLGSTALRMFLREVVFADPEIDRCVIGPSTENAAAIHAYEKAGFRYWKTAVVPGESTPEYLMVFPRSRLTDPGAG